MNILLTALTTVGTSALAMAAIAYLAKALLSQLLEKDIAAHKLRLQSETEKSLQDALHAARLAESEHQIRFGALHQRQADLLAELYQKLVQAHMATQAHVSPMEWKEGPDKKTLFSQAIEAQGEFFSLFDRKRIYLSEALCDQIETFSSALRKPCIELHMHSISPFPGADASDGKVQAWIKAWQTVEKDVPPLRRAIEAEFRGLLGV